MGYTFDGINKTITLTTGTTLFSVNDIYSRWKDWVLADNAEYEAAFNVIGGESIGGALTAGVYLFITNGWSIIPWNSNHTLTVEGNIVRDPDDLSGAALFQSVAADVLIIQQVSAVALGYSTGGGTFTSSDRALLTTAATNTTTLDTRLTATRAGHLDTIPTIATDAAALARGNISVDTDANTLTLRTPSGDVLAVFNLTDENDVAKIIGAVQRTAQ